MKKFSHICILITIALASSCKQDSIDTSHLLSDDRNKIELSVEEYISVAYDNPKEIGNSDLKSIIAKFLELQNSQKTKNIEKYSVDIKNKYFIKSAQLNTKSNSSEIINQKDIPVLKIELTNTDRKALMYISVDERFPEVLAYIPKYKKADTLSKLDISGQELLLKRAEEVLVNKAKKYSHLKDSLREVTIEKISKKLFAEKKYNFEDVKKHIIIRDNNSPLTKSTLNMDPASGQTLLSQIGPYISTQWSQSAPYNKNMGGSCPDWFGDPQPYNVAASVVTTAQILAFFQPALSVNGTQINWTYLTENPEITEPDYFNPGDPIAKRNMVASLMKYVSDNCAISYTCTGNSYIMNNIINFWKLYGIKTDAAKNFDFNGIKSSLDNVKFVYCQGKTSNNLGHSWLIDGYMVVSPTGSVSNTNTYVHANMGMGSYYNGYYLVNSNTGMTFDAGFAHFTNNIIMYTNVTQ